MNEERQEQQPGRSQQAASDPPENSTTSREIVDRHMQDQHHEITDAEMRSVKVGADTETPTVGAELQARFTEDAEETGDPASHTDADHGVPGIQSGERPPNPWDVVG
ncbi:MAG TPA: hypothetical protein VHK69_02530 [Chitinophagaceae bacterium]|jgi:hypothetical protein|nr:hypothetical protein [Chitinophagaceae bacterium]